MTLRQHNQQYIEQLQDLGQVPFLCLTLRLNQYPDGKYFGVYSSLENLGIDQEKANEAIKEFLEKIKDGWDLPTKQELEVAKENGTAMQTAGYGGIQYD